MNEVILVAVVTLECLLLSAVILGTALFPLALVGTKIPWPTTARLVGWGGVAVCVAAIGANVL